MRLLEANGQILVIVFSEFFSNVLVDLSDVCSLICHTLVVLRYPVPF